MGQGSGRFGWLRAGPLRAGTTGPPPPKLPGEVGCGARGWRTPDGVVRDGGPPPSPALPPQTAWGKGDASRNVRSAIEFSSPPAVRGGEAGRGGGPRTQCGAVRRRPDPAASPSPLREERAGRGRGRGPGGRSSMQFAEPLRPSPRNVRSAIEVLLSPCSSGGRGRERGGARGRSAVPFDDARIPRLHPRGRERGAPADAVRCRSTTPGSRGFTLPSPRGTSGEGSGEGPPGGRSSKQFAEPLQPWPRGCRSAIEFSSPPCSSGGRGRGAGGAPADAVRCTPSSRDPSASPTSPRGFWGRWASGARPEGAPRGRSAMCADVPMCRE